AGQQRSGPLHRRCDRPRAVRVDRPLERCGRRCLTMTDLHIPLVIDGEYVDEGQDGTAETVDPATSRPIGTYAVAGIRDADAAVAAARRSFDSGVWRKLRPFERGRVLLRIADALLARRDERAGRWTSASGQPL